MAVIDYPAHPNNYGGYGGRANTPKANVFHTPEELADEFEITPQWFQNPGAPASTQVYLDNDGDRYNMVPDEIPAWACGTHTDYWLNGKFYPSNRHWRGVKDALPPWGEPGVSNNCLTRNVEIEGKAATLDMPEVQYQQVLEWAWEGHVKHGIPNDRDHNVGHWEISTDRRDPGPDFPWDRLINDLRAREGVPAYEFPIPSVWLDFADEQPSGDHVHNWTVRIKAEQPTPFVTFVRRAETNEAGEHVFDLVVEDWKEV